MNTQPEFSGRDESLAMGLYTGMSQVTVPQILVTHFEYTIRRRGLLDDVAATFSKGLSQSLSPEHLALLERGERQSPEDLALAERMQDVQRDTLT
jgi:hypothetical protein